MPAEETENRNTGAGGTTGSESGPTTGAGGTTGSDDVGKASGGESESAGDEAEGGAASEKD